MTTPLFVPNYLICPGCLTVETEPTAEGDTCICGQRFVSGQSAVEWKRIFDLVGSVVAEARLQRGRGGHHLAVYGAIGKVLIDRDEFDGHYHLARKEQKR